MDILRFLAARSLFPNLFAMLSAYFNSVTLQYFKELIVIKIFSTIVIKQPV
jgi:hypothetical protein